MSNTSGNEWHVTVAVTSGVMPSLRQYFFKILQKVLSWDIIVCNIHHQLFLVSMQVTPEELKTLISKYSNTDTLAASGVVIAGTKYMFLSRSDKVVRAKKGTSGVHCIKTTQSKFFDN